MRAACVHACVVDHLRFRDVNEANYETLNAATAAPSTPSCKLKSYIGCVSHLVYILSTPRSTQPAWKWHDVNRKSFSPCATVQFLSLYLTSPSAIWVTRVTRRVLRESNERSWVKTPGEIFSGKDHHQNPLLRMSSRRITDRVMGVRHARIV